VYLYRVLVKLFVSLWVGWADFWCFVGFGARGFSTTKHGTAQLLLS